jgi:PTS hybrid protein
MTAAATESSGGPRPDYCAPVALVLVSHSLKAAEGAREIALQMTHGRVRIEAVGGAAGGGLGNDAGAIVAHLEAAAAAASGGVVVIPDFGGSVMTVAAVVEMMPDDVRQRVRVANAPFVEGAMAAAVQASLGSSIDEVVNTGEQAISLVANKRQLD